MHEAPRRCVEQDNPKRRDRWSDDRREVSRLLSERPSPPAASEVDLGGTAAAWDSDSAKEPISKALGSAVDSMAGLIPDSEHGIAHVVVADQALKAANKLRDALGDPGNLTTASERETCGQLAESLDQLRDVLVAIAEDPALAKRIRGNNRDLQANLQPIIEDGARAQLERERTELGRQLESVAGARIRRLAHEEPFMTSVARHQWLVTVSPDSWGDVAPTAAAHPPRVTDVPVSIVCELEGALLPIGCRLTSTFSAGLIPIDLETMEELAAIAEMPFVQGEVLGKVTSVVQALEQASWQAARSHLRPAGWPSSGGDPSLLLATARRLIDELPDGSELVAEPLDLLFERVSAEISATSDEVLLTVDLSGGDVLDAAHVRESHALVHVAQAVVCALEMELDQVG